MKMTANDNQIRLIDKVVSAGSYGKTRSEVLSTAILEHAKYLLGGGSPYDQGGRTVIEIDKPEYGRKRAEIVLEPVTGKAVPVYAGEVLRVVQTEGGQCVDFNGYNLHDYKEFLDNGINRQRGAPGLGAIILSSAPRFRPMYAILECSEYFDQYYAGHRCTALQFEADFGLIDHPNCQDTFAEAIREYGLTPDDVHDSYNLWMRVTTNPDGRRQIHWNRAPSGDYVDFLALFDTLSVPVICGGDISSVNNYALTPVRLEIFEASDATTGLVNLLQERLVRYRAQKAPADFTQKEIRTQRELTPDPSYRPEYHPAPKTTTIDVEISPESRSVLQSLMQSGIYGVSEEKAIIACFFRWYDATQVRDRFRKLAFRQH